MSDEGVCRTVPASPVLVIITLIYVHYTFFKKFNKINTNSKWLLLVRRKNKKVYFSNLFLYILFIKLMGVIQPNGYIWLSQFSLYYNLLNCLKCT